MAVYEAWLPEAALARLAAHGMRKVTSAKYVWPVVTGPASGVFATATRLSWIMSDAFCFITDTGRHLDLRIDPPCVIIQECRDSVRHWRWRNIERVTGTITRGRFLAKLGLPCGPSGNY